MTESLYKYVNNNKKHTYFDTRIFKDLGTIIIRKGTYDVVLYVLYIHYCARASKKENKLYVSTKKKLSPGI
jgi:hypothetical protein